MPPEPQIDISQVDYAALPPFDNHGRDLQQQRRALQDGLRLARGPVVPVLLAGQRVWLVLDYHAALTALRHKDLSSNPANWSQATQIADPALLAAVMPRPNAMTADGQAHQRRRRPIAEALARLDHSLLSADVTEMSHQLIDRFIARGSADLIGEYAAVLPILVLNRALGVEDEAGWVLAKAVRRIWGADQVEAAAANDELVEFFSSLIERKKATPGADIASWVAAASELDDDERVAGLMQLIGAGHDPTTHLMANTIHSILTIPGLYPSPSLPLEQVLTSTFWRHPPVDALLCRFATRNFAHGELPGFGDVRISAGDGLLVCFAAAHRSLDVFDATAPDLPTGKANDSHLMWGAGPHACPTGARTMAWFIALRGIELALFRLHGLRLDPSTEMGFRPGPFLSARTALPVRFDPGVARPAPTPARRPAATTSATPEPEIVSWWRRIFGRGN